MSEIAQEFELLLVTSAQRLGKSLGANLNEVREYASVRMQHLSTILGEPGYEEALIAERDSVAMMAGLHAVNAGDSADAEIRGIIAGALAIGAKALGGLA